MLKAREKFWSTNNKLTKFHIHVIFRIFETIVNIIGQDIVKNDLKNYLTKNFLIFFSFVKVRCSTKDSTLRNIFYTVDEKIATL